MQSILPGGTEVRADLSGPIHVFNFELFNQFYRQLRNQHTQVLLSRVLLWQLARTFKEHWRMHVNGCSRFFRFFFFHELIGRPRRYQLLPSHCSAYVVGVCQPTVLHGRKDALAHSTSEPAGTYDVF